MSHMRFCLHCKEWVRDQWFHCPWCGKGQSQGVIVVDGPIERTYRNIARNNVGCLNEISGKLDALETELNQFLADHPR